MALDFEHAVDAASLNPRFGTPSLRAVGKVQPRIDKWSAAFIARAPFCVVATASAQGDCDASPKGGDPGFVVVADEKTLLLPDYKGNNLFFGIRNILENPKIGLLFMIPGENWTLRVSGRAQVVDDEASLAHFGAAATSARRPQMAIRVDVDECYLHCPKAFNHSDLWNPAKFGAYEEFPPYLRPAQPAPPTSGNG